MTLGQVASSIAAATLVVVALMLVGRWLVRRRQRWHLTALAKNIGFKRKSAETDEELRARVRATLRSSPGTKEDIRILVKDALWGHGYRRVEVEIVAEQATVRAHAKAAVPDGVLRVIERELADKLPVTCNLELTAERRSTL